MQLPLPVTLPFDATFDSFISGPNEQLVKLLQQLAGALPHWREQEECRPVAHLKVPLLTLVGAKGRGKSHLLYAICHQCAAKELSHMYLNLATVVDYAPQVLLEGLEHLSLIALDNIDAVAGLPEWEEALFDLVNRIAENGQAILVCASQLGPTHPDFLLPDLRSRLSWGLTYQLNPLNDDDRKALVRERAHLRGLTLSDQALQFLLHHSERDIPSLMSLLDRLDKRSLQEQKKLSVAMVKRELNL